MARSSAQAEKITATHNYVPASHGDRRAGRCNLNPGVRGVEVLAFGNALLSMRLHSDVSIQMVQSAVGLLASVPATLVHALNFLIASARSFMLLSARNRDETKDLGTSMLDITLKGNLARTKALKSRDGASSGSVRVSGQHRRTYLITASLGGSWRCLMTEHVVIRCNGRVCGGVAGPVWTWLAVDCC